MIQPWSREPFERFLATSDSQILCAVQDVFSRMIMVRFVLSTACFSLISVRFARRHLFRFARQGWISLPRYHGMHAYPASCWSLISGYSALLLCSYTWVGGYSARLLFAFLGSELSWIRTLLVVKGRGKPHTTEAHAAHTHTHTHLHSHQLPFFDFGKIVV